MKTYSLAQEPTDDNQKTIIISETKEATSEEKITVAQLQEQHAQKLAEIDRLKVEADLIVDKLTEIDEEETIDITVKEIPVKFVK